ncbi:Transcriptional regulator LytR [Nocardia sp. RB56]|uniref:Transcriptional regulator LytR n=1 Tax=Nocardia aurantia TaxID=2585199 RepID=A0A7K0DMQ8_9NOCA|nr:Transcriptional regulator LytR [Nocardia aurantia]
MPPSGQPGSDRPAPDRWPPDEVPARPAPEPTQVMRRRQSDSPLAYSAVPQPPRSDRQPPRTPNRGGPPPNRRPAPPAGGPGQDPRHGSGYAGQGEPRRSEYDRSEQAAYDRSGRAAQHPPGRGTPGEARRGWRNPPPGSPQAAVAPRRRRRPRWGRRLLILLLILIVTPIAALIYLDGTLTRIDALGGYSKRVGDTPGTNWLLAGSDSRAGLTSAQEAQLTTGSAADAGGERSDTMMLVHIPKSGQTTIVSLPRDSYVSIPGHGRDKLNAAFSLGGPKLLSQTVEIATGLHIDHFAKIGFGGFAGLVDAVGGIDMCLPRPMNDPLAGIDLPAGCQRLDGTKALGFVRSRATALADLDRMNDQRLFLAALLKKSTSASTLANPFRLWSLAHGAAGAVQVDHGDHLWDLARLGWALRGGAIATTVPIGGFEDVSGSGNVLLWDHDRATTFFGDLAADRPLPPELITAG